MNEDENYQAPQPGAVFGGEQTSETQQNNEPTEINEPLVARAPEKGPKKSRKKLTLILLFVLLLSGGAAYWYFVLRDTRPSLVVQNQQSPKEPVVNTAGTFYIASDRKITLYEPVTKKQETRNIELDGDRAIYPSSLGSNRPITFSKDGKKMLLISGTYSEEGLGDFKTFHLSVFENQKETELLRLEAADQNTLIDWVISRDGKSVYYLQQNAKNALDLYMIRVEDKQPVILKNAVIEPGTDRTPLLMMEDGSMVTYSQTEKSVTKHQVISGIYSAKAIGKVSCACMFETPQALSPDGKSLTLESQEDGQKGGFTYQLFSTETGKTKELGAPADKYNEQWLNMVWSPDSKQIVLDVVEFGEQSKFKEPRIELLEVATKKATKIASQDDVQKTLSVLSWSLDGRLIAFEDNGTVGFYDAEKKDWHYPADFRSEQIDSSISFGWY